MSAPAEILAYRAQVVELERTLRRLLAALADVPTHDDLDKAEEDARQLLRGVDGP